VLKLINNNSPGLTARLEGPRLDSRVNLALVVLIVPVETDRPQAGRAFTAVTKEFFQYGRGRGVEPARGTRLGILAFGSRAK